MGDERYSRGTDEQRDRYGRRDPDVYGRDHGSGRSYGYSSDRDARVDRGYGTRDDGYPGDDRRDYARSSNDRAATHGVRDEQSRPGYGRYDGDRGQRDDRRFEHGRQRDGGRERGREPQGYDHDDRGFLTRAGDEVRSWFGDEDAERRREADSRYDERHYDQPGRHDSDYGSWRSTQIAALDRDYDEYRRENRSRFESEFATWRSNRQTQRQSLEQVKEHAEVLGSDGSHVGTVDKARDDRILLTRTDKDADGRHHSIPSSWLQSVTDGTVTLSKTADEAKRQWRDEEQNQALFHYGDGRRPGVTQGGATNLNRSFSGTYDQRK